ncbi:hypothetical protein PVAP13_3NG297376 [Panicum virgatum]|uniref:Uncharacterized protein n=1 Tax=Panicum virgatum TaxID=38727 RepID=A0A8T0UHL8_PANVG|nr:hypothetical protein PVAP13_3NG297376 [Panicum virgatum]
MVQFQSRARGLEVVMCLGANALFPSCLTAHKSYDPQMNSGNDLSKKEYHLINPL